MLMIVCDRQLNIKDNVIIDDVKPVWDIITSYKNKITLSSKPNIEEGDIILLKRDSNIDFIGFVTEIKLDDNKCIIGYYHVSEIFNSEVALSDIAGDIYAWLNNSLYSNYYYSGNLFKTELASTYFSVTIIENGYRVTNDTDITYYFGESNAPGTRFQYSLKPNKNYTLSFKKAGTGLSTAYSCLRLSNNSGDTLGYAGNGTNIEGVYKKTITTPDDGIVFFQYYICGPSTSCYIEPGFYIDFTEVQLKEENYEEYRPYVGYRDKTFCIPYSFTNLCLNSYSLNLELDNNGNFKEALNTIFNQTGCYINYDIGFEDGKPSTYNLTLKNNTETDYKIIRYDLPIISDIAINYTTPKYNKVIIEPEDTGDTYYRFLLKDGTITDDDTDENRFNYVVQTYKTYSDTDDINDIATDALSGNESNHNIQFNIIKNSSYDLQMYDRIKFIYDNQIFYSYVSKIIDADSYKKITIGVVRSKLSEKLKALTQN